MDLFNFALFTSGEGPLFLVGVVPFLKLIALVAYSHLLHVLGDYSYFLPNDFDVDPGAFSEIFFGTNLLPDCLLGFPDPGTMSLDHGVG